MKVHTAALATKGVSPLQARPPSTGRCWPVRRRPGASASRLSNAPCWPWTQTVIVHGLYLCKTRDGAAVESF